MQRKVGLAAVLVLLCGVSAYMWMSQSGTETDIRIVDTKETWHCSECGKQFDLTIAQATAMLRTTRHEIVCPFCKQGGAKRDSSTLVTMAGGLPATGGGDAEEEEEEEEGEEEQPRPGGSMSPLQPRP